MLNNRPAEATRIILHTFLHQTVVLQFKHAQVSATLRENYFVQMPFLVLLMTYIVLHINRTRVLGLKWLKSTYIVRWATFTQRNSKLLDVVSCVFQSNYCSCVLPYISVTAPEQLRLIIEKYATSPGQSIMRRLYLLRFTSAGYLSFIISEQCNVCLFVYLFTSEI